MKFNYQFSNLIGTVYRGGNVVFTKDGNCLLSPVGNRITMFDLVNNKTITFPFENRCNIAHLALSPKSDLLLSVDEDGRAILVNFHRRVILHRFNFKSKVNCVKFSPDGKYIAASHGHKVELWYTPKTKVEFAPFVHHRTYSGHHDEINSINWSYDSKYFVTGSRDMTCRIFSVSPEKNFRPITLAGHRDVVVAAFFDKNGEEVHSVGRDGSVFNWKWYSFADDEAAEQEGVSQSEESESEEEDENEIEEEEDESESEEEEEEEEESDSGEEGSENSEEEEDENEEEEVFEENAKTPFQKPIGRFSDGRMQLEEKHYLEHNGAKVKCADFFMSQGLLVCGLSSGVFLLYELEGFVQVHSLSVSSRQITTAALNSTGEWLAIGCEKMGQLLVWEWQSESYVLKQQGHSLDMGCLAYSPNGQYIVTGGDDGKVKIWSTVTGFCFVTFSNHESPVTAVAFAASGNVVLSAGLDGTVRAYDLVRYRNFRVLTAPSPVQYTSLAMDSAGEIICAGSHDTFDIHVFSLQTGRLLDVLSGHKGPISALAFHPLKAQLASVGWDGALRLWDVFEGKGVAEAMEMNSDALAVAYRPDGKEVAVTTLNGCINFWDSEQGSSRGIIEGRGDIAGGRRKTDKVTAKTSSHGKAFTSVCYTANGECVLAAGDSKYVCVYHVEQRALLRRFVLSHNRSLDGVVDKLNSSMMTEWGAKDMVSDHDDLSEADDRQDLSLPGVARGDLSKRSTPREIRARSLRISPTGLAWAVVSTEGLMVYALDSTLFFDPFDLSVDCTSDNVRSLIRQQQHTSALVMAFRLGEQELIADAYYAVPPSTVPVIFATLPLYYVPRLLPFIANQLQDSPHIHFHLLWIDQLFHHFGRFIHDSSLQFGPALRSLKRNLTRLYDHLEKICNHSKFSLKYLMAVGKISQNAASAEEDGPEDFGVEVEEQQPPEPEEFSEADFAVPAHLSDDEETQEENVEELAKRFGVSVEPHLSKEEPKEKTKKRKAKADSKTPKMKKKIKKTN